MAMTQNFRKFAVAEYVFPGFMERSRPGNVSNESRIDYANLIIGMGMCTNPLFLVEFFLFFRELVSRCWGVVKSM